MTTPATPCANCGGPEHPHPVMTGEDTGCMTFVSPPVSLPDALREKISEHAEAAYALGCLEDEPSDVEKEAARKHVRECRASLEAALAPYLADAARWQAIRPCLSTDGDVLDGDYGTHVEWITADEAQLSAIAQPGIGWTVEGLADAASRAVPPAPPEARR